MPTILVEITASWVDEMWEISPDEQINNSFFSLATNSDPLYMNMKAIAAFPTTPIMGNITNAILRLHSDSVDAGDRVTAHGIIRSSNTNATWNHSGFSSWAIPGCNGAGTDRESTPFINTSAAEQLSSGWFSIPITDTNQLYKMINGNGLAILSSPEWNIQFNKSPAPFLRIFYTPWPAGGGIQIF